VILSMPSLKSVTKNMNLTDRVVDVANGYVDALKENPTVTLD
jgi:hypothetical protein